MESVGPKSTTKPMSLPVLFHWTVVPGLMQKRELPLAFGMLGVAEAALAVRFTSTEHERGAAGVLCGAHLRGRILGARVGVAWFGRLRR